MESGGNGDLGKRQRTEGEDAKCEGFLTWCGQHGLSVSGKVRGGGGGGGGVRPRASGSPDHVTHSVTSSVAHPALLQGAYLLPQVDH